MNSMRDYALTLRLNFAAAELAVHLYHARNIAFGFPRKWSELDPVSRKEYVARATEILKTLQPAPFAGAKVVGRISPEEPYGVDARD
jgi:hypothetical protein